MWMGGPIPPGLFGVISGASQVPEMTMLSADGSQAIASGSWTWRNLDTEEANGLGLTTDTVTNYSISIPGAGSYLVMAQASAIECNGFEIRIQDIGGSHGTIITSEGSYSQTSLTTSNSGTAEPSIGPFFFVATGSAELVLDYYAGTASGAALKYAHLIVAGVTA